MILLLLLLLIALTLRHTVSHPLQSALATDCTFPEHPKSIIQKNDRFQVNCNFTV